MSEGQEKQSTDILPSGYHCAVTWSIPSDFGGMTSAMLRRSRAFFNEAGRNVDILTFDYQSDYPDIACELEASGMMLPGMRLRNLWDELRDLEDKELGQADSGHRLTGSFAPIDPTEPHQEDRFDGLMRRRLRYDETGATVLQVDYLRPNGSIYVSDRRDVTEKGISGGRHVSLCDSRGLPVASWNQMWPLYLFWLDMLIAGRETFMIIDSKSSANFMTRYRRGNVITMHMVHNSHMASGQVPPHGELSSVRRYAFERLSTFDSVVLLTNSQMRDVGVIYSSANNTCVIPNSTELNSVDSSLIREPGSGVMLASLTKRKRIPHALQAMKVARKSSEDLSLTIYGHGMEHERLSNAILKDGLGSTVRLAGYSPDAKQHLKSASFTLLTSTMEGLPLVLLEAMSSGCIPIAYDIPYGPADLIEDGVNGYLVEAGDTDALASRIVQISTMPEEELNEMRLSARKTAEKFSDSVVTDEWGVQMRAAIDRKLEALPSLVGPREE